MVRFDKRGKLTLRYIGPFEILEMVGVSIITDWHDHRFYRVFHVSMLRKYTPDPSHVMDWGEIIVDTDVTFDEGPM